MKASDLAVVVRGIVPVVREFIAPLFERMAALEQRAPAKDGRDGAQGPAGLQGEKGLDGTPGARGAEGPEGEQGPVGQQGEKGLDGKPGLDGKEGPVGPEGKPGASGERGEKGEPGASGFTGARGAEGPEGKQGPPGRDVDLAELSSLKAAVTELRDRVSFDTRGSSQEDIALDEMAVVLDAMMRKEFATVGVATPLMQKRVIRDEHQRIVRIVDEPIAEGN